MTKLSYKRALTIAGSDSSGGAGIQADLKTFSAIGVYGMSAVTAVVSESTVRVAGVQPIAADFVCSQIRSCLDDIGADAVKLGMLHNVDTIEQVAATLATYQLPSIVVDPVMVSSSGSPLLEADAVQALRNAVFPLAQIITPNIPEGELLLGDKITIGNIEEAAREISHGTTAVLLKGGHLQEDTIVDILYTPATDSILRYEHKKIDTVNNHGTGCTLSSAITAYMALRHDLHQAVHHAIAYILGAIEAGARYRIGAGRGPVHHFYRHHPSTD